MIPVFREPLHDQLHRFFHLRQIWVAAFDEWNGQGMRGEKEGDVLSLGEEVDTFLKGAGQCRDVEGMIVKALDTGKGEFHPGKGKHSPAAH